MDKNVIVTTPAVTLFTITPALTPCARSFVGKISEVYTHVIGPVPIEKNATYDNIIVIHNPISQYVLNFTCEWWLILVSLNPRMIREIIFPATPVRSNGRRPILSTMIVATKTKIVFVNPANIITSSI